MEERKGAGERGWAGRCAGSTWFSSHCLARLRPPKIRISEEGRERRRRSLRETRATQKRDLEVPRYPHTSPHGGGLWDARVTTPPNPLWSRFFSWMTSTTGEQRKEEEEEEDVEKKGVARIKIEGIPISCAPLFWCAWPSNDGLRDLWDGK